jgi:ATP-binding cassette subfamily B protein
MIITVILPVAMELLVPRALRYVIDQGIEQADLRAIIKGAGLMLAAAFVAAVATLGQGVARARLSQGLAYDIRNQMFAHIQHFSFANLDQMQTGQLMTRLSSDVDLVRMFASGGIALLLRALLMVAGSLVLMLLTDRLLTLLMLLTLFLSLGIIFGLMAWARPWFTIVQQKLGALNTIVQENLAGIQVVKAFVRERFEIGRFDQHNLDLMTRNIKVGRLIAMASPILTILTNLGLVAVIWLGGLGVDGGRLSIGELVAFNSYLLIGMAPLLLLGNILTEMSRAEASAERVWQVLDTVPAIQPRPSSHWANQVAGRIRFSDVSFRYDGHQAGISGNGAGPARQGGRRVLAGVSLAIEPGQRVALLGSTGSGKSTLVNLIPRFYDVVGGKIEVDGIDVRHWHPEALKKRIGTVLQQTTLFSGTIRENIAYGRPDAPLDEVMAAARAAQAHEFISQMPEAYDSQVEERGANLSGGQKQRLAIARALCISPGILILDDSTSAVDLETESRIQAGLEEAMAGHTTLIVAQRISSVLNADQIFLLDDGQIAGHGTHQELLQSNAIYQEIYQSQLGSERTGEL